MDGHIRHRLFLRHRFSGQKIRGLPAILYGFKIGVREHDQILIPPLPVSTGQCFPLFAYNLPWGICLFPGDIIMSHQCLPDMYIRPAAAKIPVQGSCLRSLILLVYHVDLFSRFIQHKIPRLLSCQFFQFPVSTLGDTDILPLLYYNHPIILLRLFCRIQSGRTHHGKAKDLCLTFLLQRLKISLILAVGQKNIVIRI